MGSHPPLVWRHISQSNRAQKRTLFTLFVAFFIMFLIYQLPFYPPFRSLTIPPAPSDEEQPLRHTTRDTRETERIEMKEYLSERARAFQARLRSTAKGKHGAKNMTREEAREALDFMFSSEVDPLQISAFLTAMRFKGSTTEELLGFQDAIRDHSIQINPKVEYLLNTNGPYDGRVRSLHLSLAASLVASAAGVPVIMHSSDDLPPKRGVTTAHVLEALGIPAFLDPKAVEKRIETHGFGFLHAYRYNFGVERMRPIREKLIYRSFIHTSEVLSNPGNAKLSMVGAAHDTFLDRFADVQSGMGMEHVLVVQGLDGGDELPLKAITGIEIRNGKKDKIILDPENYGIAHKQHTPVKSAEETADIILATF